MIKRKQIKSFWENCAMNKLKPGLVTHRDLDQVKLEIETVLKFIKKSDTLLDVGCGNGFSTHLYAQRCKRVLGIDYAENMIKNAVHNFKSKNLKFEQQDVLNLGPGFGKYSVVLSTRCLINIISWPKQQEAIRRLYNCLEDGGHFILIEGTQQGRRNLNNLRTASGLQSMPRVWHNLDFNEIKLRNFLGDFLSLSTIFDSVYMIF